NLLVAFAESLTEQGVPGCDYSSIYKFLRFYRFYPQILETVYPKLQHLEKQGLATLRALEAVSPKSPKKPSADDDIPRHSGREIMEKLSYSHISLLLAIDDPYRRAFYEMECMKGNWSYRELKRQIGSLYFERTALSTNKPKLREIVGRRAEIEEPKLIVRDPMVFEFLGLKPTEVMLEEDVERRMLDKLQELLLELGHGFCFEGRQKRILIDGEYFFVDLVFYHRILRCHVLFELKMTDFKPDYMGQLHTYVNWYRENVMTEHDQPPIGILLCTGKSEALVKYATAGLDNKLFVSRYLAELPTKEELLRITSEE
ncbi:MAG: PDDEXK nuclease domain-containing protein, partial [Planctomycetaceae bacterium]|nr:PDDEXK nuclease domain-containing protein [Planctomycetaceae bacterium]